MKGEYINDKELRRIFINQPELNFFCNNSVKTAKYNIFTFIPLAIFYQFNNYFNIFFLITAVILSIKIISPMDPAVAIFPFVFVLSVSIIREAIEDFKKAQFDKTYNNSKVKVINSEDREEVIKWSEVRAGNIIKIEKNDIIASDVLILKTSDKNNIAFMQTTNLDGENSLKLKEGLSSLTNLIETNNGKLNLIRGIIEIDQPNSNIYKTNGKISINDQKYLFNNDNILLRSATLKNIDFVYGIVIYTGKDTKIMNNNNQKFSLKISSIERSLNKVIIAVIIVVFSICIACTVFGMIFMGTNAPNIKTHELKAEYIYYSENNENPYSLEFFKLFGSFFIIFNNIIPISLTITFEIAKGLQVAIMEKDKKMKKNDENFKALSLKIQEDLGNVRYIFTDKTGTLTKNELEFKACSVINRIFYNSNKNQINSKSEKIKEEINTKYNLNNCDTCPKKENDNGNKNKKFRKSMFSDDFPILSLKQALLYDFPINFNIIDGLHENISIYDDLKKNSYELKKEESEIYNKNDIQIENIDYKENINIEVFKDKNIDDTSDNNKFNLNIIRAPNVTKYNNINKNTNNLILEGNNHEIENKLIGIENENIKQTLQSPQNGCIFENKNDIEDQSQINDSINYIHKNYKLKSKNFLQNSRYTESSKELIKEFFINIALNHNVLLNEEENKINYQGPNPDEVTLTSCSYEIGIKFLDKNSNNNIVKLEILGEEYEFEVLFKVPFQSSTKRSSIVVREKNKNKYSKLNDENPNDLVKIYIKGADNVIFDLIDENSKNFILPNTKEHLDLFAKDGLRTLCYTVKYITSEDFLNWKTNYNMLINQTIEGSNEAEIDLLIRELEKNSILLGVTGLEDKLQNKVKDTINDFIEARIHMWMLTGDNIDTAESIGHSSQIFNDDTEVFKLKASESKEELKEKLKGILEELENMHKVITRLKLERKKKNQKSKLKSNNNDINKNNKKIENNSILSIKRIKVKNNSSKNIPIIKKSQFSNGNKSSKRTRKMSKFSNVIDSEDDIDKQIPEKDKNNSDDEFSRNKNGKYVNKILNKRENQQESSTIRKLDSLYLQDKTEKTIIEQKENLKLNINNYMDYSQENYSYSKDKNQMTGINKNYEENKSKRNFGNEKEYSETLSDEVDELSVIKFMIERNFFDNSQNKLIGNMTFLNKIIEMSKDTSSLIKKASNKNLKDNLKQVMEYLIENKNLSNENVINSTNRKLSENFVDNDKPQDYKIKIICPSPKFSEGNIDNKKLNIKTLNDLKFNSELEKMPNHPNSLNEEIKRINNLKPNYGKIEKNYRPSISPLKIYKNIENKSENILDLFNNLKNIDVNKNANIIKSESLNNCNNINSYNIPILNIAQENLNANEHQISQNVESNLSVKCNDDDKTTKSINLSTIYENYQKELNRFKIKKENAKKILKFTSFNFKDMKEKKPIEELEEIPEIDLLNFGLILEGDAISHCMDNELSQMFWTLIKKSRSIICCRCNPIQKSQIVNFVKNKSSQICLAIGDGGNDVNMIKAANVGIGIFGKEGYQAAYSSDYAISEFKYLRRLLFYHGRYFILRNSYFIYFFFYKSLIFNIPNLWFAFFSGFSGTLLWDSIYFLLYTSILTTMPPVVPMIYEEDIDIEMEKYPNKKILRNLIPDIYKETRDSSPFNSLKFLFVFIMGCLHSAVIFFVPLFVFGMGNQDHLGRSQSIWDHSLVGIITILIVQYYILIQDTYLFNFPVICAHGIQITVNVIFFNLYACLGTDELGLYTYDVVSNFKFWFSFLLILFISLIPVIISRKIEFFLSQNIVNNLRNRNFEDDYTRKICVKKIEQMHKCSRSLAKFRKIYNANKNNKTMNIQNLADKKMKEIVDQYKKSKIESKSKKNFKEESNNNKEQKLEKSKNYDAIKESDEYRFIKNATNLENENQGKILQILIKNKANEDFVERKKINLDIENSQNNHLNDTVKNFNSDEIHEKIDEEKNNSFLRIFNKKNSQS